MSDRSAIEWADATWNPGRGCTKVWPGCKFCYAELFAEGFRGVPGHPFEQGFDLRLVPEKLDQLLHWRRPRKIFVDSMSDLFHEDVPTDYIARVGRDETPLQRPATDFWVELIAVRGRYIVHVTQADTESALIN